MNKLELVNGAVNGWICEFCKTYNDILDFQCCYKPCKGHRDVNLTNDLSLYAFLVAEKRKGEELYKMDDKRRKELHIDFYNKGRSACKDVDDIDLAVRIEELEVICAEGKATLRAYADEQMERHAKMTKEERENLLSKVSPLLNGSDALKQVQIRKDRMSKADKVKESLKALGLPDEEVNRLMNLQAAKLVETPESKKLEDSIASEKARIKEIRAQELAEANKKQETIKGLPKPEPEVKVEVKTEPKLELEAKPETSFLDSLDFLK